MSAATGYGLLGRMKRTEESSEKPDAPGSGGIRASYEFLGQCRSMG